MDTVAEKRPLLTSLRSKADLSVSAGAVVELCPGAGAASALMAAGEASPFAVSREFWTAKTVAPSKTAPRTARRNGREIAIAVGIGSPPRQV